MADGTKIEWTDATWNPMRGCTRVSEGCRNCYAERIAARFSGEGQPYQFLAAPSASGPRWTGKILLAEHKLDEPLHWRKPRMIFVNSMSDLFHEDVPDEWIDKVFVVMFVARHHIYQILTKRSDRLRDYLSDPTKHERWSEIIRKTSEYDATSTPTEEWFPRWAQHVWLGVSVEDQARADERIPHLLATPAAVRFVSAEPLLGPVEFAGLDFAGFDFDGIRWVIAGGESGPGARPMHPDWTRSLRDQCAVAGVPFFFKQWGEWGPYQPRHFVGKSTIVRPVEHARSGTVGGPDWPRDAMMYRVGKKTAGALLDGREHQGMP